MAVPFLDELVGILTQTKDDTELGVLIEGLLTPQEVEEVVYRWRLMARLRRGDHQRDIARELGISLGKISRGSRLLQYGPEEFRLLMDRIEASRKGTL